MNEKYMEAGIRWGASESPKKKKIDNKQIKSFLPP